MFNSLKEAAAKQAAKLKEVIDEAAQQDAAAKVLDRKQNSESTDSEELQYLKMENEALKARLREAITPPSEREAQLEAQLAMKTSEHEKLAEKSRELMLRYRKLQAEKASLASPESKAAAVVELEHKLVVTEDQLRLANEELTELKQRLLLVASQGDQSDSALGTREVNQTSVATTQALVIEKEAVITELRGEVERLKNELSLKENITQELVSKVEKLENHVSREQDLENRLRSVQADNHSLQTRLQEQTGALEAEKSRSQSLMQQLSEAMQASSAENENSEQFDSLKQQLSSSEADRAELAKKMRDMSEELKDLTAKLGDQDDKMKNLADALTQERQKKQEIESIVSSATSNVELETAQKEISRLESELNLAEQRLKDTESKMLELRQDIQNQQHDQERDTQRELDRTGAELSRAKILYDELVVSTTTQAAEASKRIADLHSESEALRNMLTAANDQLTQHSKEIDMRVMIDRLERRSASALASANGKIEDMQISQSELRKQVERLHSENDSLKKELALRAATVVDEADARHVHAEMEILREREVEMRGQLEAKHLQLKDSNLQLEAATQEHEKLRLRAEHLEAAIREKDLHLENVQLQRQTDANERLALEQTSASLQQLTEQLDFVQSEKRKLELRVLELADETQQQLQLIQSHQSRIQELEILVEGNASLQQLHDELARSMDQIKALEDQKNDVEKALVQVQAENIDLRVLYDRSERKHVKTERNLLDVISVKEGELASKLQEIQALSSHSNAAVVSNHEVELRVLLDRSERLHAKSQARIRELEDELSASKKGEAENQPLILGLEQANHSLTLEVNSLMREVRHVIAKEIEIRVDLDRAERVARKLQQRCAELEKENNQLNIGRTSEADARKLSEQADKQYQLQIQGLDSALSLANAQVKKLEDEQQNHTKQMEELRAQSEKLLEQTVIKLRDKEKALEAADEMMKSLAASFDERSALETQLKRELENERIKVEEMELKMRSDFDKLKFELQHIFDEKAKQLSVKLEEAQQEAEAANIACSGFQRQLKEAHDEIAKQTRELDTLKERTRDALLNVNEEKKELQERLASTQLALEKKSAELAVAVSSGPPNSTGVNASETSLKHSEDLQKLEQEKTDLEEALELSRRAMSALKAEATTLKVELDAAQGLIKSTESAEQRFVMENSRLKEEIAQIRQESRTRKERAEKLLGEREAIIEKLNERVRQLQDPENMRATLEEEEALREENKDLRHQLELRREELEKAAHDVAVYKRKIAEQQHNHQLTTVAPARHPEDPAALYLKNVLISYMSSRDPREQLGMVKAISQLAGFTSLETEKIKRVLEDADRGVFGKLVGTVLTLGTNDPTSNSASAAAGSPAQSTPRIMKRVG